MKKLLLVFWIAINTSHALKITWYGHSAFLVEGEQGTRILIDPWIKNPKNPIGERLLKSLGKVDFVLVSHGHGDNLGDTLSILNQTEAKVVTSYGLSNHLIRLLDYPADRFPAELVGDVGGKIRLNSEVEVLLTKAVHSNEVMDKQGHLHHGGPALGFVLNFSEGRSIYHTGDTDLFLDMKLIPIFKKVDIMLTCIGGHFTMDPQRASVATMMIKPSFVIPMHFGTYPLLDGTSSEFKTALEEAGYDGEMIPMKINKTLEFFVQ